MMVIEKKEEDPGAGFLDVFFPPLFVSHKLDGIELRRQAFVNTTLQTVDPHTEQAVTLRSKGSPYRACGSLTTHTVTLHTGDRPASRWPSCAQSITLQAIGPARAHGITLTTYMVTLRANGHVAHRTSPYLPHIPSP